MEAVRSSDSATYSKTLIFLNCLLRPVTESTRVKFLKRNISNTVSRSQHSDPGRDTDVPVHHNARTGSDAHLDSSQRVGYRRLFQWW
jgi:hypothetical protein